MIRCFFHRNVICAIVLLSWSLVPDPVHAVPIVSSYNITHTFQFPAPPTPVAPNQEWRGNWGFQGRSTARTGVPACDQNVPFGRGIVPIAPNMNQTQGSAANCPPDASSNATSSVSLNNFGTGTRIAGAINVTGMATADLTAPNNFSTASANSVSALAIQSGIQQRNGRITWGPVWRGQVSGFAVAIAGQPPQVRIGDPIDFQVINIDTGDILLQDRLLDISASIIGDSGYGGYMNWDSDAGIFEVGAYRASFSIIMDSPFTLQQGELFLEIDGGIVTRSDDNGIFDGLLPSLGSLGLFSMPLNAITFDYDLGDLDRFGVPNLDINFDFAGDGEAFAATVIPEPSTFILLGLGTFGLCLFRLRGK